MKFRDIELLSTYLDGRLSPSDAARLEARLASDAGLKAALDDLSETRTVLRRLPRRRAPRSFRLTPTMAGVRPPAPRAYPVFRFATAIATLLFLVSVAVNAFAPVATQRLAAAPAPAYGMGGGGGGGPVGGGDGTIQPPAAAAPAATEAPLQQLSAPAPTATLEGTQAADAATNQAIQTEQAALAAGTGPSAEASKAAPLQATNPRAASSQPVPVAWIIALGILMVACGAIAWLLRVNNERRIRRQWNQK